MNMPDALLPAAPDLLTRLKLRLDAWRIQAKVERLGLARVRDKYLHQDPSAYHSKYWSIKQQIPKNVRRAYRLELHRGHKRSVLDLGTGFGYFPFICKYYGHQARGLDLDDWAGRNLYRDVTELLGVERVLSPIRAFCPIPDLGRRFDLVTAFACLFNHPNRGDAWSVLEWEFFIEDLMNRHLQPEGSVMLSLNRGNNGEILDPPSRLWFAERGAYLEDTTVYLHSPVRPH